MTSTDISGIVNGKLTGQAEIPVTDIVTDSRQLSFTEGLAFFAIRGKNHDGHFFIENIYKKGVRTFVVEKLPENPDRFGDASFIEVKNTITALQELAAYKRKKFNSPVVAVTGSAGKTIVKEWLADILGLAIPVIRSPRSYNSQIGVPLSVWKLDDKFRLGIFEAGISFPGEMDKLRKIINPDIGVITNIGDAHSENFPDNEAKAREKLKLFENASVIIYCSDQDLVHKLIRNDRMLSSKELIDWSFGNRDAVISVRKSNPGANKTRIEMSFRGTTNDFIIPFADRASVENAITAASVCLAMNTDPEVIRKGLSSLVSVAMRMDMKTGINNCSSDRGLLQLRPRFPGNGNRVP